MARLGTSIFVIALGMGVASAQSPSSVAAAPARTAADQPTLNQPATTIPVRVNVVNVFATVRDKHGKIVSDLTKEDFSLSEDGRPQTIHYFAKGSDLPLTLGLLVDTSLSQRRVLDQERNASSSFLQQMVRTDKDKAFVIHFDREVELLQDLTSSHEKLASAIDKLETPQLTRTSSGGSDPDSGSGRGSGHHFGGGTLLYDAVYLASDELMKKQEGRKALIVLSDGVDQGSKESLDYAIETAQRSNTVVYSILFKDDEAYGNRGGYGNPRWGGPGMGGGPMGGGGMGRGGRGRYPQQEQRPDGKKILERISRETGGRMFEVSKKEPVDQIYAQIEDELRNQYSLGYTPDRAGGMAAGYHKIQLAVKQKDLVVQARDGYYAEQ